MPYIQRLMELKNLPAGNNPLAHTRQIQGVVDDFMTKMTILLRERKAILDELHLPLEACIRLLALSIDRFVQQGLVEAEWEVPDEVLLLFPDDVRAYFRPGRATDRSAEASLRGEKPTGANS
jgi:hypothetical protein